MAFTAEVLGGVGLVITRPAGTITDEQLVAYYRGRLAEGTLQPGQRELVDGRGIEQFDVGAMGQRRLVELLKEHRDRVEGIRWAFVAKRPMEFGMFRMFEAQKGELPFETRVFRGLDPALEWLDVPPDVVPDTI